MRYRGNGGLWLVRVAAAVGWALWLAASPSADVRPVPDTKSPRPGSISRVAYGMCWACPAPLAMESQPGAPG